MPIMGCDPPTVVAVGRGDP